MRLIIFFLFLSSIQLSAQDISSKLKEDMVFYGDVMISAQFADNRQRAAVIFNELIDEYLNQSQKNSVVDLSFVKQVTSISPEDSLFTISSWQLELDNGEYEYYGYIFYNDRPFEKLYDTEEMTSSIQYEEHTADQWYGALYYNVVKYTDGEYLIFGSNANGEFNNSKVADILHFSDGKMVLGKEVFQDKEDTTTYNNKLYINFSSDASVSLNYNPGMEAIVHDHLMQRIGRLPGQGPTHLPDGTYEGYQFADGYWAYNEKLFHHSYGNDNAPRPQPVLNTNRALPSSKKRR